jgi:hypothetical protein
MALAAEVPIQLNILGKATHEQMSTLEPLIQSPHHLIEFHAPRSEQQLFEFLAQHEIGLALEKPVAYNREICRTNKLYTYPLVGCYMFASQTKSQAQFLDEFPATGQLIELQNPKSIASAIEGAFENREDLWQQRTETWTLAREQLNWEKESEVLINTVHRCLN